jgi:hypothetical protein
MLSSSSLTDCLKIYGQNTNSYRKSSKLKKQQQPATYLLKFKPRFVCHVLFSPEYSENLIVLTWLKGNHR